jgi:hypothetical protein
MSGASFNNFFNGTFGTNIKVPERTLKQIGKTANDTANGVLAPLFNYLEENETVFNGDIQKETIKFYDASFNIGARMREADIKVNGETPKFDTKF